MTDGDKKEQELAKLRESIEVGIAKSKRLVARSRALLGAVAAAEPEEPEPPAIAPDPVLPNPPR